MKKKYFSPEFELERVLINDIICASGENPISDVHENEESDDV